MQKALVVVFLAFIVGLAGILVWYRERAKTVQEELDRVVADAQSRKLVSVDFIITPPAETPTDQTLYLSGSAASLGNWQAAGVPLKKREDGKFAAAVELMSGVPYEYKVTRGTWGTVEKDAAGKELANRTVQVEKPGEVDAQVATWVDGGKSVPGRVTMTGNIRLHQKLRSDVLGNERNLIVYLPPGYESGDERYPVLYMQDGQNLFDEATSFAGIEWKVDETAQQLIEQGKIEPVIIVGIYNTEQRTQEFTPASAGGRSADYAKVVVEEIKPFIDSHYRTQPDAAHTAIAGSSLGGLVTLLTVKQYPDAFGKVAVLTPYLRSNGSLMIDDLVGDGAWLKNKAIWIDMGGAGGDNYPGTEPIADAQMLVAKLNESGLVSGADYRFTENPDGAHNEAAWSETVDDVLLFLYGK